MKKTKEENTSSGARKKKGSGGRLTGMLESMQKRSNPTAAHKVATKYFDDFKKERQIPAGDPKDSVTTAVDTGEDNAVITAVSSAVTGDRKKRSAKIAVAEKNLVYDPLLSHSENMVYSVMYEECVGRKSNTKRFGLKELKEKTGLSDKTIRVSIHSLEKKMNVRVVEPSLGVYGRKFKVNTPDEVAKERKKSSLVVDPTTKKVVK